MGVLNALAPFIELATAILQMIGTAEAMSYLNQLNQAKMDLQNEIAKGYQSDDAKIESLYGKIQILGQTVQSQFSIYQAKGINAQPSLPVSNPVPAADPVKV